MTIEEATKKINDAKKGEHYDTALEVISQLSEDDKLLAAGRLEEMAIILDYS